MTATATTSAVVLPAPARARTTGMLIAVLSALAFSSSGPFTKPLFEAGWSLGAVLIVRMGVAGLILSPALWRALAANRGFIKAHGLLILAFGLTAVAGCQVFFFSAMQRMPVAVALLIQYFAPVLLVLFAWARTRTAPARLVLAGSAAAMIGLVLVVDVSGASFDLWGVLLALAAAVCTAAYFVIAERAGSDLPPLALASGGLLVGAVLMAILVAIGVLPFHAPAVDVVLAGVSVPWFVPLLWVAAVGTTLGYALGVMAVPRIGTRLASFIGLSEVLFALMFAWIFLGERPSTVQFVGGAVLLLGVALVRAAEPVRDTAAAILAEPVLPVAAVDQDASRASASNGATR